MWCGQLIRGSRVQVSIDINGENSWKPCFTVDGVRLPTGYYFGASATTGDLSGVWWCKVDTVITVIIRISKNNHHCLNITWVNLNSSHSKNLLLWWWWAEFITACCPWQITMSISTAGMSEYVPIGAPSHREIFCWSEFLNSFWGRSIFHVQTWTAKGTVCQPWYQKPHYSV